MKKYIVAAIMAVAAVFGAAAQNSNDYALLVNTKDGAVVEYSFEYTPEVTFDGDEIVVIDEDMAEGMRFNMADILNLTIKKPSVGVADVAKADMTIAVTKESLSVSGLAEGAVVSIYNMSGALVASATAGNDGAVVIAVDGLGAGVFMTTMPGNSFKFIR